MNDLFDHLHAAFAEWLVDGRVTVNGAKVALAIPDDSAQSDDFRFTHFSRAYLRLNPVVGSGPAPEGLGHGLILKDRTSVLIVRALVQPTAPADSWGVTGSAGGGHDRNPPTFSAPITKDAQ